MPTRSNRRQDHDTWQPLTQRVLMTTRALARRVRALREARGWSRERLAKEAGIAVRTLARLEGEGAIQSGFP
jgi:ribosome-binding protein aMBF1 (putative translation factor)